jgi:hypothetical protein
MESVPLPLFFDDEIQSHSLRPSSQVQIHKEYFTPPPLNFSDEPEVHLLLKLENERKEREKPQIMRRRAIPMTTNGKQNLMKASPLLPLKSGTG